MTEWKKKRQIKRHYNRSAKVYDNVYSQEQNAKIRKAINNLPLKKDSLILDVGCGTGLLFPHITETAQLVVGTDISAGILNEARKKAKQYSNVALLKADADHTPIMNHTFDAVFAITLLQNMPDPLQTLSEMKRVSRNDAFIVTTGLKKTFSRDEFTRLLQQAGVKVLVMDENGQRKEHIALCTKQ